MGRNSKIKRDKNKLRLINKVKKYEPFDYQYLLEIEIEIFREYFIRTCGINGIV